VPTSELQWLGALGLVVGGLGAIVASGRPSPPWLIAVLVGGAGAFGGGYVTHIVFGDGFPEIRRTVTAIVAVLFVGAYSLSSRSRRLSRSAQRQLTRD
jgi:hypothetical protein